MVKNGLEYPVIFMQAQFRKEKFRWDLIERQNIGDAQRFGIFGILRELRIYVGHMCDL